MTDEELAALAAEITSNPAYADWIANGNDQQIADALNAITKPVVGKLSRARFSMWCGITGLRAVIADHAANPASPLRSVALTVQDFLLGGVADAIDFADPVNQAMLQAWVQAGAITPEQVNELLEMATTQEPVFGTVTNLDVARALGRMGV
jgi:hypothetical protein